MKGPESKSNTETQESAPRRLFSGLSSIMDQVLLDENSRNSLRVGKILSRVNATLVVNEASPESSAKRLEDGSSQISLGAMPFRRESVDSFGWGVDNAKEQLLIKLAHESAHVFQNQTGYEQALVNFLNGSNEIDEKFHPYLELYAFLNTKGVCNGLADMNVYHRQNRDTGLLSMNTLEDMTEFIGAYLISDDYFNFRLEGSKVSLSDEDKKKIAVLVIQIVGM
ncbi:MAG: hypothetical protein RI935_473 [Candidatus Parcubacteria bacterium]|jgi:hypothetical protein